MFGLFQIDAVIEQAKWDSSKIRDKVHRDIDAHITAVQAAKLSDLNALYEVWFVVYSYIHMFYCVNVNPSSRFRIMRLL